MKLRRTSNGQLTTLATSTPLGAGGEARIYAIKDSPGLIAKIYHRPTRERADKLQAMLANPPEKPFAENRTVSIAWPLDVLTAPNDSSQVIGFLMPRVNGMQPIIDFYHPKTRRQKHPLFSYLYLLRTASNLAGCVSALHARGYVIGDLNESNILVGQTALVCLVDTDSFQVPDTRTGTIYRCRVGKPEFTPPELQSMQFAWIDRRPEHDLFGLGVLIFQLLMEGTHPFAGKHPRAMESPPLEERIAAGAFPYAPDRQGGIEPMSTAPPFGMLGQRINELFQKCFVAGHNDPSQRPTAQTWQKALLEVELSLAACQDNSQHRHGNHLRTCPWCERRKQLNGLDPFPSLDAVGRHVHFRSVLRPRRRARDNYASIEEAMQIAAEAANRKKNQRLLGAFLCAAVTSLLFLFIYWTFTLTYGLK